MTQADILSSALAEADDETQAAVLNEFVTHLTVVCRPHAGVGNQQYYIAKRLTAQAFTFFEDLCRMYRTFHLEVDQTTLHIDEKHRELRDLERQIAALQGQER